MDLALQNELSNEPSNNQLHYIIDRGNKYSYYIDSNQMDRDMELDQFIAFNQLDFERFGLPLQFWFDLNNISDDTFFEISEEIVKVIGFSQPKSLYRFIRKNFQELVDFTESSEGQKIIIKMTKRPFKQLRMDV